MTVIDRAAPTATITLARADLAYGLRAAAGLKAKHVHLAFAEGTVRLLAFNPDFLADICSNAPVERLTLRLISPLRPMLVEAARDEYLLMPVRLNV